MLSIDYGVTKKSVRNKSLRKRSRKTSSRNKSLRKRSRKVSSRKKSLRKRSRKLSSRKKSSKYRHKYQLINSKYPNTDVFIKCVNELKSKSKIKIWPKSGSRRARMMIPFKNACLKKQNKDF
jgi:exonuclease VII large subunit